MWAQWTYHGPGRSGAQCGSMNASSTSTLEFQLGLVLTGWVSLFSFSFFYIKEKKKKNEKFRGMVVRL